MSDFPKDEWRHIKTLPTEELFGPPLFGAPWQCFLSPWLVRWWFGGCGSGWFGAIQPRPWLGVACRLVAKGVGTLGWKFGGKKHAKWPTVVVSILRHLRYAPEIQHHYGFQALAAGVTFAIVFRTQLAWNRQGHIEHMLTVHQPSLIDERFGARYWEAVTQLHFMYSKFADAFQQFYAFAEALRSWESVRVEGYNGPRFSWKRCCWNSKIHTQVL